VLSLEPALHTRADTPLTSSPLTAVPKQGCRRVERHLHLSTPHPAGKPGWRGAPHGGSTRRCTLALSRCPIPLMRQHACWQDDGARPSNHHTSRAPNPGARGLPNPRRLRWAATTSTTLTGREPTIFSRSLQRVHATPPAGPPELMARGSVESALMGYYVRSACRGLIIYSKSARFLNGLCGRALACPWSRVIHGSAPCTTHMLHTLTHLTRTVPYT